MNSSIGLDMFKNCNISMKDKEVEFRQEKASK